jgi:hypothetical protein
MMAACGVLCSECPAYLAQAKGTGHQARVVEAWRRIYGLTEAVERISCSGCLGPDDEVFHTSRSCKARSCCRARSFSSCAECAKESCVDLEAAQSLWDDVPNLAGTLSGSDFATYARPYCGHRERLAATRAAWRGDR